MSDERGHGPEPIDTKTEWKSPARARLAVGGVAVAVASIGLASKLLADRRLAGATIDLGPIALKLARNPGAAFGLGDTLPTAVLLMLTALIALAIIGYAWRRAPRAGRVEQAAGGAVIGGAVANLLDRAGDGVVIDYLHTGWWPTFNLADTSLVIGFSTISVLLTLGEKNGKGKASARSTTTSGASWDAR